MGDSITVIEGDHIMPYTKATFHEVFKWDSVFQTSYDIVSLEEINDDVIAEIALSSIRNNFLQDRSMTCKYQLSFSSGLISEITSLDCIDADWTLWQSRVSTLVDWISINHPSLDGFIHDMSMRGAQNYVKAIELYQSHQISE